MAWYVTIDGQSGGPFTDGHEAYDAMWETIEHDSARDMRAIERKLSRCSLQYVGTAYSYDFYNFRTLQGNELTRWFKKWCGGVVPPVSISWMICENPGGSRLGDMLGASDTNAVPKAVRELTTKLGVKITDILCFDIALFNQHQNALVTRCLVRNAAGHQNPRRKRR